MGTVGAAAKKRRKAQRAPAGRGYLPRVAKTENWTTPQCIIDIVEKVFGSIELDPCSNPESIVPAARRIWLPKWADWYLEDHDHLPDDVEVGDGLAVAWFGATYFNPPYNAKALHGFMERAVYHADAGGAAIGLIPSKTDIKAWHAHVSKAAAICLIDGRVKFGPAENAATFANTLALWSKDRAEVHHFCAVMVEEQVGQVWRPA
jgi:hypothetical protein